ncbi:MAG: hypothetical protein HQ519_09995 [Planctomycetes bacterium]|nr:hypothetical protein [Planctomycetota bacterium]NQU48965.1 hypothetical protein [Planctomycetota bacterium]
MLKFTSLLAFVLLSLASCGSDEPTPATFTDASSAIDHANSAMNSDDFGSAIAGFQYALDNTSAPGAKMKISSLLFQAHVKNNDSAAAQSLLAMMKADLEAEMNGENLSALTNWCINQMQANVAQNLLDLATEVLDEDEMVVFDPEKVGKGIAFARAGDKAAMAQLGYVGD